METNAVCIHVYSASITLVIIFSSLFYLFHFDLILLILTYSDCRLKWLWWGKKDNVMYITRHFQLVTCLININTKKKKKKPFIKHFLLNLTSQGYYKSPFHAVLKILACTLSVLTLPMYLAGLQLKCCKINLNLICSEVLCSVVG